MTASLTLRVLRLALGLASAVFLSACSGLSLDTFKLYVPEVVQGNVVSREQREYLRPGMTRAQVRDVLGTPLLVSLFHADRWDYAFTIKRQGVPPQKFHMTVFFKDDVLSRIESDELPSEVEFVQRLSRSDAPVRSSSLEATPEQLRQYPAPSRTSASPTPSAPLPFSYPPLEPAPR